MSDAETYELFAVRYAHLETGCGATISSPPSIPMMA